MKNLLLLMFVLLSSLYQLSASDYEKEFQQRADFLVDYIADVYPAWNKGERPIGFNGGVSDFGKYNYPKVIAVYKKYGTTSSQAAIQNERMAIYKDKPTFHFNLVGLPRILFMFSEADVVKQYEVDFLKRVFERNDSYNPWTCEGTENHVNMSRTPAYLYAQIASEKYPELFPEAKEKLAQMKEWLHYFSKRIYETGEGEWNSSTYLCYTVSGWLNLYDFASDPEVKQMAKAVLDYLATEIALNYVQGMIAGPDMRGKGCRHSLEGSTAYLGWLWYGDLPFEVNNTNFDIEGKSTEYIQSIHAATSSYRPPHVLQDIVRNKFNQTADFYNSKPSYLLDEKAYIKQTLHIEKSFMLGAGYFPYGGWSSGNWQIVSWKMIARVDTGHSAQFVSGIGMQTPSKNYLGNHRTPFDQLAHHKNVLIQFTKVPVDVEAIRDSIKNIFVTWREVWEKDFRKRFPTDTDHENPVHFHDLDISKNQSSILFPVDGYFNSVMKNNICFVELEKVFCAVRSLSATSPSGWKHIDKEKVVFLSDSAEKGKLCGLLMEVVNRADFESFEAFQSAYSNKTSLDKSELDNDVIHYQNIGGDRITACYSETGVFTEPIYDWGYGPVEPSIIHQSPPFIQPEWPSGKGHGKLAGCKIDDDEIYFDKDWPVFYGPFIKMNKGVLFLTNGTEHYQVNYSGQLPVFSNEYSEINFSPY